MLVRLTAVFCASSVQMLGDLMILFLRTCLGKCFLLSYQKTLDCFTYIRTLV